MTNLAFWLAMLMAPSVAPDSAPPAAWQLRGAMVRPGMPWRMAESLMDGDWVVPGRALVSGRAYTFFKSGVVLVRGVDDAGREVVKSVGRLRW